MRSTSKHAPNFVLIVCFCLSDPSRLNIEWNCPCHCLWSLIFLLKFILKHIQRLNSYEKSQHTWILLLTPEQCREGRGKQKGKQEIVSEERCPGHFGREVSLGKRTGTMENTDILAKDTGQTVLKKIHTGSWTTKSRCKQRKLQWQPAVPNTILN